MHTSGSPSTYASLMVVLCMYAGSRLRSAAERLRMVLQAKCGDWVTVFLCRFYWEPLTRTSRLGRCTTSQHDRLPSYFQYIFCVPSACVPLALPIYVQLYRCFLLVQYGRTLLCTSQWPTWNFKLNQTSSSVKTFEQKVGSALTTHAASGIMSVYKLPVCLKYTAATPSLRVRWWMSQRASVNTGTALQCIQVQLEVVVTRMSESVVLLIMMYY